MNAILAILLLFILSVAGFLAYHNSKLASAKRLSATTLSDPSLSYSIFYGSSRVRMEDPDTIPLFECTVTSDFEGLDMANKQPSQMILCRVATGTGDLNLADAENTIMDYIRLSNTANALIEHKAYLNKSVNHSEQEAILNLEDAVKSQIK